MEQELYQTYTNILRRELVPAMGCTEPIAIAYAGALARQTLGRLPESVEMAVSGNIIKNVKSVIVPHTGGKKGLRTAVAAGICYGDPGRELEVLSDASETDIKQLESYLDNARITVSKSAAGGALDIQVKVCSGADQAYVHIVDSHTNVVLIQKNGETVFDKGYKGSGAVIPEDIDLLNVEDIVAYADTVDLDEVQDVLKRQIQYNMEIARTGIEGNYGANIGRILVNSYGISVHNRAKAWAAAGSDARMNGCELPVIINSGSGNQGLTASVPVVIYAQDLGVSESLLLRALIVSNLVTIHLKAGIGSLSAYCGATSAGAGAGAGICYLHGGRYRDVAHTIVNALAINSGMICDGAKSSCAAKIASAVEAGLLGWRMFAGGSQFYDGDGIVIKGVENTINTVSELAREGMRSTDAEIIKIMLRS